MKLGRENWNVLDSHVLIDILEGFKTKNFDNYFKQRNPMLNIILQYQYSSKTTSLLVSVVYLLPTLKSNLNKEKLCKQITADTSSYNFSGFSRKPFSSNVLNQQCGKENNLSFGWICCHHFVDTTFALILDEKITKNRDVFGGRGKSQFIP